MSGWALVAGSSGAIGGDVGARLTARGIPVVGIDRRPDPEDRRTYDQLRLDLCDEDAPRALRRLFVDRGAPRYVAAATGTYVRRPFLDYSPEEMLETVTTNLVSTACLLQAAVEAMVSAGGGKIVVVTSQAGAAGGTDALYASAKGGLAALVKSIAREFGRSGVICNAVSPGPVESPMSDVMGPARRQQYRELIPIGRLAEVSEIGEAIEFLLLMEGAAVHGATIDVDGGLVRR